MTNKIIKFPETLDQAWKRIDREYDYRKASRDFETKRIQWFAAGYFTGAVAMIIVFGCVYWFWGKL